MSNKIRVQNFKSRIGELIIGEFEDKICLCDWKYRRMRHSIDKRIKNELNAEYHEESCELIDKSIQELREYLDGERCDFDIPLLLVGTEFQKSVWNKLIEIPFGNTETYLGLSRNLSNEKAIRVVASANGANAISIFVPCHRIIGSDGSLVGYAGGLTAKKKLLILEKTKSETQLELFNKYL